MRGRRRGAQSGGGVGGVGGARGHNNRLEAGDGRGRWRRGRFRFRRPTARGGKAKPSSNARAASIRRASKSRVARAFFAFFDSTAPRVSARQGGKR